MKHALKGKAIEHKVREAKALGQDVDPEVLGAAYDDNISNNNNNNIIIREPKERTIQLPVYDPNVQLSLKLDLAMNIGQAGKLFIDLSEDTFEDGQVEEEDSDA